MPSPLPLMERHFKNISIAALMILAMTSVNCGQTAKKKEDAMLLPTKTPASLEV